MKKKLVIVAALALCLSGCLKEKTVDATDKTTLEKSLEDIRAGLGEEQKEKFNGAVQTLIFSDIQDMSDFMALASKDEDEMLLDMGKHLDGKTANEIIQLAKEKKTELNKKQLESIEQEITELTKKKAESENSSEILNKIEISNPKFYWSEQSYSSDPVIDFTIKNNTDVAILRSYFHGTVASPGRSIPWISEEFNYEFKGGLEPGESKHLQLAPNMFGDWAVSETKDRNDLVMTIEVKNISDANDEELAVSFSDDDQERLDALKKEKAKLMQTLAGNG